MVELVVVIVLAISRSGVLGGKVDAPLKFKRCTVPSREDNVLGL